MDVSISCVSPAREPISSSIVAKRHRYTRSSAISIYVITSNTSIPENGYKITRFLDHARVCDPHNLGDIQKCMHRLRQFHEMKLKVDHRFNLFDQIDFYEKLWNGRSSAYRDYQKTKENVFSLRSYIERYKSEDVLTHIDAVPDNFLFTTDIDGNEDIRLIDWEYAGMQDPHLDIAMFCIYSLYNKEKVDQLISLYFTEGMFGRYPYQDLLLHCLCRTSLEQLVRV